MLRLLVAALLVANLVFWGWHFPPVARALGLTGIEPGREPERLQHQLHPERPLLQVIPGAVDEVGGSTVLATLTVIAALLPMAFLTGLTGPYMSPIPINASMGMLLSLGIAFSVTPWLARLWMKPAARSGHPGRGRFAAWLERLFARVFAPLLDDRTGRRHRSLLGAVVAVLIVLSLALPAMGLVILKMLPFDDKSEFQVVVDMPAGTSLEHTAGVLHELGAFLAALPEVSHYQAYAGTASPINFNGLMRQYYLRGGGEVGDLQVTLQDKAHRSEKSHAIVKRLRELESDFQNLLRERELTRPWKQLLDTFRTAALLQPLVVVNGRADSQFLPSHLAAQGFYLLRARTQLREIRDILLR